MARKKSAKPESNLANVAVMAAIRGVLTYRFRDGEKPGPGQRVQVPLGNRRAMGIVVEPVAAAAPGIRIRNILRVIDTDPVLSPVLLRLGSWISDYYLAPIGEVFRAMLPLRSETAITQIATITSLGEIRLDELASSLLDETRLGAEARLLKFVSNNPGVRLDRLRRKFVDFPEALANTLAQKCLVLSKVERGRDRRSAYRVQRISGPVPAPPPRLSPAARRILEALDKEGCAADHRTLLKSTRATLRDLHKLKSAGLVDLKEIFPHQQSRMHSSSELTSRPLNGEFDLMPAQESVLKNLVSKLDEKSFSTVLLHGITASGKTEIKRR